MGNNIKQTESETIQDRQRAKQYKTPQRDGKGDKRQRLWIGWLVDWGNTTDGKRWRTDTSQKVAVQKTNTHLTNYRKRLTTMK